MRDEVLAMLEALGVTGADEDALLDTIIAGVQWRILNLTNLTEVPEGLQYVAVRMAVGEYLNVKKATGSLDGFDLEAAEKSIQEGDTNVTYAIGEGSLTPEERLTNLIDHLINGWKDEIYRYRKLVW